MSGAKAFSRIITDETLMENVRHGSAAFPFQYYYEDIWNFDFHCIDWHWHPELEYVYVQSGCAVCFAGEEKLYVSAGNGLLINSRVIHRFEAGGSTIIPNVVFSPFLLAAEDSLICRKYVFPFLSGGPGCILFDRTVPWQAECIKMMQEVFSVQENDDRYEMKTVALLLAFWRELIGHRNPENGLIKTTPVSTNHTRLQVMMQYIQEHYRENISLEDIAASVHIGKSTALEIFHQGIRQSPVSWLIHYRLKQAAALLSSTEKKIAGIAEETGFESSTYFCRKFKSLYGITPKEYRDSMKEKTR